MVEQVREGVAPSLAVTRWFNTDEDLTLESLRGRVVVVHAFQMLCPGCVSHGLPQAQRIHDLFEGSGVTVLGLHTVFEHHAAMTPVSLEAFIHEYRISFPVAVDAAAPTGPVPETMAAYGMRGTPSLVLIDKAGRVSEHFFGRIPDLVVGAAVANLVSEHVEAPGAGVDAELLGRGGAAACPLPTGVVPGGESGTRT